MAYVKISDPNIIDLAAWHQLINVVNQHSDSISALTNNFGLSWNPDYDGDNWSSAFDFGSQQIVYGRAKLSTSDGATNDQYTVEPGEDRYVLIENEIEFTPSFSKTPVVTATLFTNQTASFDGIVTVGAVTESSFTLRVANMPSSVDFRIVNWIAIGAK